MLRNVDWTLLGQIEFGRAELRHSNCATFRTCILGLADFIQEVLFLVTLQENGLADQRNTDLYDLVHFQPLLSMSCPFKRELFFLVIEVMLLVFMILHFMYRYCFKEI